jgi:NAD(P)-dependent dehydrogenase (short-subunit alcohol dehydrogenase family)
MFEGKVIIVTGGASGIGNAICRKFVEYGGAVALLDILEEKGTAAAEEIDRLSGSCSFFQVDATHRDEVNQTVKTIIKQFGKVDVLINNIGWNKPVPFLETEEDTWYSLIEGNLMITLRFSKAVLPTMIELGSGSIVNMGSVAGMHPWPGSIAYGAAKAGIISVTRSLASGYASHGIRVNCICPGPVETDLFQRLIKNSPDYAQNVIDRVASKRVGSTEEIAESVAFLCSDRGSYINGAILPVDGGFAL